MNPSSWLFGRMRMRLRDMGTIKALCLAAESHARRNGEDRPGEEHFLLAAVDLPDGTARRVLERVGVDTSELDGAINAQYVEALGSVGIGVSHSSIASDHEDALPPPRGVYHAGASAQSMLKLLAEDRRGDKLGALLGAHVLRVIASRDHGVAARTLRVLGVDADALDAAVAQVLAEHPSTG